MDAARAAANEIRNMKQRNLDIRRTTRRFTSEDPIRSGRNWYGYCANNPATWTDPWGLEYGYIRDFVEDLEMIYASALWDSTLLTSGDYVEKITLAKFEQFMIRFENPTIQNLDKRIEYAKKTHLAMTGKEI